MKFKANLNADIQVTFDEPEKAKAEFIDGDWGEIFWDIPDMESLVRDLSFAVHNADEKFDYNQKTDSGCLQRSPEGFGLYIKCEDGWVMDNEHTGKITVNIAMLDVESVREFDES